MSRPPPSQAILLLHEKPVPLFGLILTGLLGALGWALALLLTIVLLVGAFVFEPDSHWSRLSMLGFIVFAAFIGWLFSRSALSFWRERRRLSELYLAVTADELIYQHYDMLNNDIRRVVIPRKNIFRIDYVTYPGGAESPSTDTVRLWYRQPDGQEEALEMDYWYGGINLYQELKKVLSA